MTAQHTPGPLMVRKSKRNGDHAVVTASGDIVAECYEAIRRHDERASDEAQANAELFASAPTLKAELEKSQAQGTEAFRLAVYHQDRANKAEAERDELRALLIEMLTAYEAENEPPLGWLTRTKAALAKVRP